MAAASIRSADLKAKQFEWTDIKRVHEITEGDLKGYAVAYIDHPDDLARLGKTMGHCAGTHFVWACEEKIWYFFTIIGPNGQPHITLHTKQLKWLGKDHPRDAAPYPYQGGYREKQCPECRGYGGKYEVGNGIGYYGDPDVVQCDFCNGSGYYTPQQEKGEDVPVPQPKSSAGGYPTYKDVCAAFESVGRKYEAGKWAPLSFNSRTYEIARNYKEPLKNFDAYYGRYIIKNKPADVDKATWDAYQKACQSMKAEFDKNCGAVQIVGRTFKFDGKELYVLSLSGKGDAFVTGLTKYRRALHEFFVESSKRKAATKKEVAA